MTSADLFESVYRGESAYGKRPPWEIDGPQPSFVTIDQAGLVRGAVLDPGCGTGETSLYLASKGHVVTGFDFAPTAIEIARRKAEERGLEVTFEVDDVLGPARIDGLYDTVVDSGTARMFDAAALATYAHVLHRLCRPGAAAYVLAISDRGMAYLAARLAEESAIPKEISKKDNGSVGLNLTVDHIRDGFAEHWMVESIAGSAVSYVLPATGEILKPHAWLYQLRRI